MTKKSKKKIKISDAEVQPGRVMQHLLDRLTIETKRRWRSADRRPRNATLARSVNDRDSRTSAMRKLLEAREAAMRAASPLLQRNRRSVALAT